MATELCFRSGGLFLAKTQAGGPKRLTAEMPTAHKLLCFSRLSIADEQHDAFEVILPAIGTDPFLIQHGAAAQAGSVIEIKIKGKRLGHQPFGI